MGQYYNYFLTSKHSRLTEGHLPADELYKKIQDHDGSTAYCCYFDLDYDLLKIEYDTGVIDSDGKTIYEYVNEGINPSDKSFVCNGRTFTQYEGICRPALNCISFDFDADNPSDALDDVRRFTDELGATSHLVFFSGSKGFHVMVPFCNFPLEPNEHLHLQLKDLAKHLKEDFPTLDTSIYNYNRKFRVPFSQHEKTGLYKIIVNPEWDMDYILEQAELEDCVEDFDEIIKPQVKNPHKFFIAAIEASKRKSYEVEKERAGTIEAPSPFEKYDNKLCIKKMLESRCDDIGRNNACIRIVNDYFRTGKSQSKCEKDVSSWATENNLPLSEVSAIISNIYERGANYNFGCQDECKELYCSAKCSIWKKLDPDKRPITVDMPVSEVPTKLKNEFVGVTWLMQNIFGCEFNEVKKQFSGGLIVKQDAKHLFYYKDKHWQHLDEAKIHILKTKLNAQYDSKLTTRKLDSVWKMFTMYVPEKPDDVDMFAPRNDMANFLDGTLHLEREGESFKLNFKEHDKNNFCTTVIEQNYWDYLADPDRRNDKFEDWLFEFLKEDEQSFKLVQEMFGASIMPKIPQFFILLGKSGTGKSTTIKILKKLHKNDKNISGVSPDKFHGFHMRSMIGKLMNIVGDIKTNCSIDDDTVKQVDDQEPVRIEVKGSDDVYTKLPALHIFGANKMPKTDEGYSGAMDRRFTIINFDKVFEGKRNIEIANDIFNHDPLGILCFAMRGLKRMVEDNGGEYSKTSQSQKNVSEWTKQSDIISFFIDELKEEGATHGGELLTIKEEEEGRIERKILWEVFKEWQVDAVGMKDQWGRIKFYSAMGDSGYPTRKVKGIRYIKGISKKSEDNFHI